MLVAKREPFHSGSQELPRADFVADHRPAPASPPRFSRAMSAVQMLGALLAIPLGLASGYSMYRANFSVDSTCQSLRGNIVSMLDKSVDAHTRHMLVRRDVIAFEQTCGRVDPDATAAFKSLLASDRTAAAAPRHVEVKPAEEKTKLEEKAKAEEKLKAEDKIKTEDKIKAARIEDKSKDVAHKAAVHQAATQPVVVDEAKAAPRDAALSDAAWIAAVRGALKPDDARPPAREQAPLARLNPQVSPAAPVVRDANLEKPVTLAPTVAPPSATQTVPAARDASLDKPTAPQAAPPIVSAPIEVPSAAQPPAAMGAVPPAAQAADHPVPPASIPDADVAAEPVAAERHDQSRLRNLIGAIPLVGRMIDGK